MKLSMDGLIINSCHTMSIRENNLQTGGIQMNGVEQKFDEIILTSSSRDIEEKIFTETLGKQMKNQLPDASGREKRIEELKASLKNGVYVVDSRRIAAHMLYQAGE